MRQSGEFSLRVITSVPEGLPKDAPKDVKFVLEVVKKKTRRDAINFVRDGEK